MLDNTAHTLWHESKDEKYIGVIGWSAVRNSASCFLPHAVAGWKHQALSSVEEGVQPLPSEVQNGMWTGPLECSPLGWKLRATSSRNRWVGARSDEDVRRLHREHRSSMHLLQNFRLGGLEKLAGADDPRHTLQRTKGKQTSVTWITVSCAIQRWFSPVSQPSKANIGAERNRRTTQVIYCIFHSDMDNIDPEWKDMIRNATNTRLVAAPLLLIRLDALVEDAAAAFLETLDDSERATALLYLPKADRAANGAFEQVAQEHHGPAVVGPTVADVQCADPTLQKDADGEQITNASARRRRLNALQLKTQVSRLSDRTKLRRLKHSLQAKRKWQQVVWIEDLCNTHVSHKWLWTHVREVSWRRTTLWSMFKTRQGNRSSTGESGSRLCGTFWIRRWNMERLAALSKPCEATKPGVSTKPRGLTETTSRSADMSTTAAVSGRGAALDVCAAHQTQ